MNFLQRIGNALSRFMYGRNGVDKLGLTMLWAAILLNLINMFLRESQPAVYSVISLASGILMLWTLFRMFSRNVSARSKENQKFLVFWNKVKGIWYKIKDWFSGKKRRFADRKTHCYFSCPKCKRKLRVPKGKGKIEISCPICGTKFIKKT